MARIERRQVRRVRQLLLEIFPWGSPSHWHREAPTAGAPDCPSGWDFAPLGYPHAIDQNRPRWSPRGGMGSPQGARQGSPLKIGPGPKVRNRFGVRKGFGGSNLLQIFDLLQRHEGRNSESSEKSSDSPHSNRMLDYFRYSSTGYGTENCFSLFLKILVSVVRFRPWAPYLPYFSDSYHEMRLWRHPEFCIACSTAIPWSSPCYPPLPENRPTQPRHGTARKGEVDGAWTNPKGRPGAERDHHPLIVPINRQQETIMGTKTSVTNITHEQSAILRIFQPQPPPIYV